MHPNLVFWSAALLWMAALLVVAFVGVQRIRRGDLAGHRRAMHGAIAMVFVFVVAYGFKVAFLGKEALHLWTAWDRGILYFHETMVATMLLAGGTARWLARRLGSPQDRAKAPPRIRRRHRLAGRLALISGSLALVTALLILAGMVRRQVSPTADAASTVGPVRVDAGSAARMW